MSKADNNEMKLYVPHDTRDILEFNESDKNSLLSKFDVNDICNLNLLINKFVLFDKDNKADIKSNYEVMNEINLKKYQYICDIYIDRFKNIITRIQNQNFNIRKIKYKVNWRLAVGLGEASVYETSIKLHHIYSFPYIPASSFKGTIRTWVINNHFNGKEETALKDSFFVYVFGSSKSEGGKDREGNVVFFDVYPVEFPKIELDIINNHYVDYYKYGMSSPPGDYYNPNLVNFLTVKEATFEFIYGYYNNYKKIDFKNSKFNREPDEIIDEWIDQALNYQGIGAKTSVGYGYFTKEN